MSTLTESLHSNGEKEFLLAFHSSCVGQANIEYEAHLSQNPKITEADLPFNDFLQSRLPFYQQAFELGLNIVNDVFYTEEELEVLDVNTGKPRIYKYNFETNTVFYEKSVSKPTAKASAVEEVQTFNFDDDFSIGETSFKETTASPSLDEDLEQEEEDTAPEIVSSQIYADPLLVDYVLQKGIESITRDYLDFAFRLEKVSREESQAWLTIKKMPSIEQDLVIAAEYKKALDALSSDVERVTWFANLISTDSSAQYLLSEALQRLEQAKKLTDFFILTPSTVSDGRRITAENSFAVAMIGDKYDLSRIPKVWLEDVVTISKIVYDIQKEISDPAEVDMRLAVVTAAIFETRRQELTLLLEENNFPVDLGLEYFETILRRYIKKMPSGEVVDYLEGSLEEFVMYNLLHRNYQVVVDTRESKFQHIGLFSSGLKDGRFLTAHASHLEKADFEDLFGKLFTGEMSGFTELDIKNAILSVLRHFSVSYNEDFDAYEPASQTRSGRTFETEELLIYRVFIESLVSNFDQLPASFNELMSQIRIQVMLLPNLKELQEQADERLKALHVQRVKDASPWVRRSDLKAGDRYYLDLDGFVEYYMHSVATTLLNRVQEGGYYSRKIDYTQIRQAVLIWTADSTKRAICARAVKSFRLQNTDQLVDYISIKMNSLLAGMSSQVLPTENSIALQLENSLAMLASTEERNRLITDFDARRLSYKEFIRLPVYTQLRLIDYALAQKDKDKKSALVLDLFEYIKIYYRTDIRKFNLRNVNADSEVERAKRTQCFSYLLSNLLDKLDKDPTLVGVLTTILMQSSFYRVLNDTKPKDYARTLGSDTMLTGKFFTFFRKFKGKWPTSVGSSKSIYNRRDIIPAVEAFCIENEVEIKRKIAAANAKIANPKFHYDVAKYKEELKSYALNVFDRTYRKTHGANVYFGIVSDEKVISSQQGYLQRSLDI